MLIYNANLRQIGAGDTLPARYLPLNLWHQGTFELDAIKHWVAHGHPLNAQWTRPSVGENKIRYFEPWAYWMIRTKDHRLASLYPVLTPLIVAPLYLPAVAYLNAHGWEQPQLDQIAEVMEKLSASVLASVASVLMYILLRRECGRWSLPLALAFAFGSNTWMISSQALWQHGTGELLIALALLLAVSALTPLSTAALGAVCVGMAANRPPDALLAGAIILVVLCRRPRSTLWLLVGVAVPLAILLSYNIGLFGNIAGGYGMGKGPSNNFFQLGWTGIAGLLVSPTRGLLVFSPFLLLTPVGLIQRLRESSTRSLALALSFVVAGQLLLYSQADWRAGTAWGPRWLTDLLPVLVWMLAPALPILRPIARGVFYASIGASIVVQAIGAFWYTKASDELIFAGDSQSMRGAWKLANTPFLAELRHPRARGELHRSVAGSVDLVGQTLHPAGQIPQLDSGSVLEGWALGGGRTPAQLIALVDGVVVGSTETFLPRVDVNEALHTTAASGWHLIADTRGVRPGERALQIAVRLEPRSDIRMVRTQRVFIGAEQPRAGTGVSGPTEQDVELDAIATCAASLLREQQNPEGYWLTSYTDDVRFESPRPEMNTFLTAMLIDLLLPIAHENGLEDVIERARRHLGAQIESDGLVRYHGRPDGATIGTLGCVITPDADDTALAWRIAGRTDDPRRQHMLEELARFRDERGLYRTWLAPRAQYQCLDPGRDPNPTDATIQMHVYLMLRDFHPLAAQSLCHSLKGALDDEDVWVYYADAPLIPYLRSAELCQQGCQVPLPTDRLTLAAAGQELWSEATRQLVETTNTPPSSSARARVDNLLAQIGRNNFSELHRSPPLIYHNDLNATVRRYYWSEAFGYALWLRLYHAAHLKPNEVR